MKKHLCLFLLLALCLNFNAQTKKKVTDNNSIVFKVLQFNIWQEGTIIPGGYEAIVDQILESKADIVTLSEVRNYKGTRFCDRIVESLKNKGQQFYSFYSYDSGILSRYPIIDSTEVFPCIDDHGSVYRALIDMKGTKLAVYTAHLDYLNCTYYDVKGYSGQNWKKRTPMTDLDSIMSNNVISKRDNAIMAFLDWAEKDRANNHIVILGGDFNEPSHLDWIESTKHLYDRQGLVVPWTVSVMLAAYGYKDTYREVYPDPLTHPGTTYPSDNPLAEPNKLSWVPDADERERIDFIYYAPYKGLKLIDACIWGPKGSIARNQRVEENSQDVFKIKEGVWPTDHKAVLSVFTLHK